MAGYSAVKPTLAKLAKFRQIRHRQCCGKTLSKLPNLPLRAFLDISGKVSSQHCTGVGRGKMRGEQNFPTLMAKVVENNV